MGPHVLEVPSSHTSRRGAFRHHHQWYFSWRISAYVNSKHVSTKIEAMPGGCRDVQRDSSSNHHGRIHHERSLLMCSGPGLRVFESKSSTGILDKFRGRRQPSHPGHQSGEVWSLRGSTPTLDDARTNMIFQRIRQNRRELRQRDRRELGTGVQGTVGKITEPNIIHHTR